MGEHILLVNQAFNWAGTSRSSYVPSLNKKFNDSGFYI